MTANRDSSQTPVETPGEPHAALPGELDVVVIGGGVAGLAGALTLARARRSVLVVDSGEPRNAPASAAHGLLSRDGVAPLELLRVGREEVTGYGGRIVSDRAVSARRVAGGFVVTTASGRELRARRLLVTTGLVDELPEVAGLRERWGRDVLHCPYCHGWEFRDAPIGVLGGRPASLHQTLLMRQWSSRVTLFLPTGSVLAEEDAERLAARGITVVEGEVTALDVVADRLAGVKLASGRRVAVAALVVAPRLVARAEVLSGLGLAPVEHPMGTGTYVASDATGLTEVAGVWVAGNVTESMATLPLAQAGGVRAAMAINADLVHADTEAAVARHRSGASSNALADTFGPTSEAEVCARAAGRHHHDLDWVLEPEGNEERR
ncbi:NAD(P)/FAD-dependent oxidoreductase [Streptomyces sp. NPDC048696]|uniref:NAD(P)/FAD-dependent oxidoreductase n=1 Tax=Streptomyces sp. NPDC048696 TaxID=3365585 RepID=UPI003720627A